jgi:hypothetical protein
VPWTPPTVRVTGELITAGIWNADLQANLLYLKETAVLSSAPVLEPGISGQRRAGRALALADFTTVLGLPAPAGLWPGDDENDDSGNARHLSVRGTVPHTTGITGTAGEAWLFDGGDDALYRADEAGLSIRFGSWGCWFSTSMRGAGQTLISKWRVTGDQRSYRILISGDKINCDISLDGTAITTLIGVTDVADGRLHFAEAVYDGASLRLFLDGKLEASAAVIGSLFDGTAPFNIGGYGADGATATSSPHFGRVQNAFVTPEVHSEDQHRLLYAAKIAHGRADVPADAYLSVRRRLRGGPLATSDFPVAANVRRLYNLTDGSLADLGSNNTPLVATGGPITCPGPDGLADDAYHFDAVDDYLSATDAGLPVGTDPVSLGCWFRTLGVGSQAAMIYGTPRRYLFLSGGQGKWQPEEGGTNLGPGRFLVNDGRWHLVVWVLDNNATDGFRRKLYVDGLLDVADATAIASIAAVGANGFRLGASASGISLWSGGLDGGFVYAGALTADEIAKLWAVGSLSLGVSPKETGAHVERIDATDVYLILDTLESSDLVDLKVRS